MMPAPVARPLQGNELMFWGFDRCLPTNFAVFAQVEGALDEEALRAALPRVQARHPLLQATLEMRGNQPWFRPGGPPLALETLKGDMQFAVQRLAAASHARFDVERGPLAQFMLVRHDDTHATVAVTLHHTIGDGLSGINVVRDWLHAASFPDAELAELPPHPSLAASLQSHSAMGKRMQETRGAQRWLAHTDPSSRSTFLPAERKAAPHERGVIAHLSHLDADFTKQLAARCRDYGATVHGALHAAVGMTVAGRLPTGAPTLTFGQPIDMRSEVEMDVSEVCGCMISAIAIKERVHKQEDFWLLARRLSARVRDGRANGAHRFILDVGFPTLGGIAKYLSAPLPRPFGRLMEAIHPQGLILSNLGRVEPPETKGLHVSHMGLAVNPGITSALTHTATTLQGRMSWMFLATEPLLSRGTLERIARDARGRLERSLET